MRNKKKQKTDDGNLALTIKARIEFLDPKDAAKMQTTMEQYRLASSHVSQHIFDNGFDLNQYSLQKGLYTGLRSEFGLKSTMAQSCIRQTAARYKSRREQLAQNPAKYDSGEVDDNGYKIYLYFEKDLEWLEKPINFSQPQVDLVRGRDWSFLKDGTISLNTLNGRVFVRPSYSGFEKYMDGTWEYGTAKVVRYENMWFLHISATKNVGIYNVAETCEVVGIDRGIHNIMATYDTKGKGGFTKGKCVQKKHNHYKTLRKNLQKHNTKSSKRRIRTIGQRENRWMNDVNHCLSKTLVNQYDKNTLFVMENLVGADFAGTKHNNDLRDELSSWSHFDLGQKITYKAALKGSKAIEVSPRYTSQHCPMCGRIRKENRDHEHHIYICDICGYQINDDRIAAMNLTYLGLLYINGDPDPKFKKTWEQKSKTPKPLSA